MVPLSEVISEVRNDADRDFVYNHEDLLALADRLEHCDEVCKRVLLGQKVYICHDNNWAGVVTEVKEKLGGVVLFKVEWRSGREFCNRWFTKKELDAFAQLEEP